MPILDISQPRIDVFLLGVRLCRGEKTIQVCGVGFVLPVMHEGVDVDLPVL
jgi:hypothetical protein